MEEQDTPHDRKDHHSTLNQRHHIQWNQWQCLSIQIEAQSGDHTKGHHSNDASCIRANLKGAVCDLGYQRAERKYGRKQENCQVAVDNIHLVTDHLLSQYMCSGAET